MTDVPVSTDFIKLDSFLKFCGACDTGGQAKAAVQDALIKVNGEVCAMRGKKLVPGDVVEAFEKDYRVTRVDLGKRS